ncbi:argininosuccinate lyase [Aureicoccus marinus]|uniref:Argininosuccinate lyase n=1 Tax=Aureicoccus marinus TaxID=754435 RepID=A0A2S7T988_9FLAO|nr:argininosuccinate lyase [Aureicoccus marinus]PQJ16490.1 argininosuccinate lyase [Aureicoccus marinus]
MKLWNKQALQSIDQKIERFTVGQDRYWDMYLFPYDIQASKAHAQMLGEVRLISGEESQLLQKGLDQLLAEYEEGTLVIEESFEDMHSKIEFELTERLGETGKKIHTARSRNDQVLVALQLYQKESLLEIKSKVLQLFQCLLELSEQHAQSLLPGYTHMQVAMPSSFGLWFSAYAELLIDDTTMINAALDITDQNPLGSAAGYGSSFPIDRMRTTELLGFSTLKYNVVAAQLGRGRVERSTATALSQLGSTWAKLCQDICLYLSQDLDFISFPESLTTGSSIMPHKKNPDVFELLRAKGNSLQQLPLLLGSITQNLSSGYHRDLQLLKGPLIQGLLESRECLDILLYALPQIQVKEDLLKAEKYRFIFSVDTLNELVKNGVSFREAYQQMGQSIAEGRYQPKNGIDHQHLGSLGQLALEEIRLKMKEKQ